MLTDLRVKLRTRYSHISSCGFQDFLPQTKQFFAFLDNNSILKAIIAELLARNQKTVHGSTEHVSSPTTEWPSVRRDRRGSCNGGLRHVAGILRTKTAITVSMLMCLAVADFEQIWESIRTGTSIRSSTIWMRLWTTPISFWRCSSATNKKLNGIDIRKCSEKYQSDTGRGEKNVKRHMFEFLFDQGLPFHVEPACGVGRT